MFNYSKLRGLIIEKFGNQRQFAEAMGVSKSSMSYKLCDKVRWSQEEILKACEILGINHDEIVSYFFTPNVQEIEQTKDSA